MKEENELKKKSDENENEKGIAEITLNEILEEPFLAAGFSKILL